MFYVISFNVFLDPATALSSLVSSQRRRLQSIKTLLNVWANYIGSYAWSGIGKVVDLLAAVHYISCGAAIWDPSKSVKRPFNVTRTLYS